jgi:F-type H+-transporting ATPase subunit delta
LFRLCLVDGRLDEPRVHDVSHRIAQSHRRGTLAILSSLKRLVRLERDRHTARIESATPLGDTVRDEIQSTLARRYGPDLDLRFEQNPALIGGMRITVASDVYDDSVRTRLTALEARL